MRAMRESFRVEGASQRTCAKARCRKKVRMPPVRENVRFVLGFEAAHEVNVRSLSFEVLNDFVFFFCHCQTCIFHFYSPAHLQQGSGALLGSPGIFFFYLLHFLAIQALTRFFQQGKDLAVSRCFFRAFTRFSIVIFFFFLQTQ